MDAKPGDMYRDSSVNDQPVNDQPVNDVPAHIKT